MSDENTRPSIRRNDDIEIKLPMGVTVRASGKQVTLVIVIIIGVCSVLWLIREHDLRSQAATDIIILKQQELMESLDNVGYILTLTESERKGLKMTMPPKLRKQLLNSERER